MALMMQGVFGHYPLEEKGKKIARRGKKSGIVKGAWWEEREEVAPVYLCLVQLVEAWLLTFVVRHHFRWRPSSLLASGFDSPRHHH